MVTVLPALLVGLVSAPDACPGAVEVQAEEGTREILVAALEEAEVHVLDAASDCVPVRADVVRDEAGRFALRIEGPSGSTSSRTVVSLATVVALIESWSVEETEMLELPAFESSPIEPPTKPAAAMQEPERSGVGLSAMAEVSAGDDGSFSLGPGVELCARLDWACIDVVARFGYSFRPDTSSSVETSVTVGELALGASIPFDLGLSSWRRGPASGVRGCILGSAGATCSRVRS